MDREIGKLDPTIEYPPRVVDKPRGRVRFAKKVHLPYGWLESRTTTHEEREALFGDDPMDASYLENTEHTRNTRHSAREFPSKSSLFALLLGVTVK